MIIYNVTIKVQLDVHDPWLRFMRDEHIPHVMETGCFTQYKMYRILEEDTRFGITYSIHYYANTITDYFDYKEKFAPAMRKETEDAYGGKFTAERAILREILSSD